jgi:hypothetical protein
LLAASTVGNLSAMSRARHFVPHAVIVLGFLAGIMGARENACLVVIIAGHLAVPIWSAVLAMESGEIRRGLSLGPGTVIGVHAVLITVSALLIEGHPEDTWLAWMVIAAWLGALAVYTAYALVAYFVTVKIGELVRRRRR